MNSSEQPSVSIVVPVYNTGAPLRECLESLLQLEGPAKEIIISNDGSTDPETLDIIDEFGQKYPAVIRIINAPNGSAATARNRGIDAARGEWLFFCDSDDWVEPDLLTRLLALTGKYRAQFASCALRREPPGDGREGANIPLKAAEECLDREALRERWLKPLMRLEEFDDPRVTGMTPLALFPLKLLREKGIRFPDGLNFMEDELFMLAFLTHVERAAFTSWVGYHYRASATSLLKSFYRDRTVPFWRIEAAWEARWCGRLELCRKFGWESWWQGLTARLLDKAMYHQAQCICTSPDYTRSSANERLCAAIRGWRQDPLFRSSGWRRLPGGTRKEQLFRICVRAGLLPVRLFCRLAQWQICRKLK